MYVLVTGAAGRVGTFVTRGLRAGGHRVRALDIIDVGDAADETFVGDIGDFDLMRRAMDGVDAVIHLGGNAGDRPWAEIRNNNYVGCYNAYEAARELGVKRFVFASRAGLLGAYPDTVQRTVDLIPRPRGLYDISKVLGESFGYMYSSVHGMECVSVRIGNFNPERDRPEHPHHLSHGDCVRLFEAAVCHEDVTCEIVFGVSDSDWALYDVDHGRSVIGYDPQDVSHVAAIDRTFDRSEPAEPLGEAPPERVLITGAAGRVGRVLAAGLRERFEIRGFDQVEMPDLDDTIVGDIGDHDACLRATKGVDAVVHLAGVPSGGSPWQDVLRANFDGTYQIMEAARQSGVHRVAFASRAGILGPYPKTLQRTVDMMPRPQSYYTMSKIFGEGLGHMYAWRHGIRFTSVRIGNFKLERDQPGHPHQLGHADNVRAFESAITHCGSAYEVIFGVSDSDWPLYDVEHGRQAIGYEPQQRSTVPESERA
ncbi:MAG: NAD(P)-dependent oxidoreductase [Candidatus Latescibacterota bacterium]|nr:NAD(P)-dependent oxidoreductase [Candidatus Latescibacterota bacterium]